MEVMVSPTYLLDTDRHIVIALNDMKRYPFDDGTLPFLIFKDRMEGWFFEPAQKLLNERASIAAVHVVTPLIEALEERYQGRPSRGNSESFFCARASAIFGITDRCALKLLYRGLRCGFAHHGFLKDDEGRSNILIRDEGSAYAITYDNGIVDPILWIDARKYVDAVRDAYHAYYVELSSVEELRCKFLTIWWPDWQMSFRVPGGCGATSNTDD